MVAQGRNIGHICASSHNATTDYRGPSGPCRMALRFKRRRSALIARIGDRRHRLTRSFNAFLLDRKREQNLAHSRLAVERCDTAAACFASHGRRTHAGRVDSTNFSACNHGDDSRRASVPLRTSCSTRSQLAIRNDNRTLCFESRDASRTAWPVRASCSSLERRTHRCQWSSGFERAIVG